MSWVFFEVATWGRLEQSLLLLVLWGDFQCL